MKVSFKNHQRPSGLAGVCWHQGAEIKADGLRVGSISEDDGSFRVWLSIKKEATKEEPAPFKNVRLAVKRPYFDGIKQIKEWVKQNWVAIEREYQLYQHAE